MERREHEGHKPGRQLIAGVDVGGSKIAVLVVDGDYQARGRALQPTPLDSVDATLEGIAAAVREALAAAGGDPADLAAVGLGTPGQVDERSGVVRLAVNLGWEEVPAGARLEALLGAPCFLENDVRLAAIGVQQHPAYAEVPALAYLSVGTGIAAGLILDGRLYRGAHGMAGEIGHMIVDRQGPRCACGARGCLEALTAGPALARQAQQALDAGRETRLRDAAPLTAQAVYAAAAQGDAVARDIVQGAAAYLAQALQQLVMTYDLECIVLGGGVARERDAFFRPIMHEIDTLRQDSALAREMLRPEMFQLLPPGYDAGPWGAVTLAGRAIELVRAPAPDVIEGGERRQSVFTWQREAR